MAGARELWACRDPHAWSQCLSQAPRACGAVKNKALVELDRWYREQLPVTMLSRSPPHLTRNEMVKLVEWKMARGKWRPRLTDYAKQQEEQSVVEATAAALKAVRGLGPGQMQQLGAALDHLTALKGVGPATASAVLAAAAEHAPFMSDEALEAALGKRDYTRKAYLALAEALQGRAQELNAFSTPLTGPHKGGDEPGVSGQAQKGAVKAGADGEGATAQGGCAGLLKGEGEGAQVAGRAAGAEGGSGAAAAAGAVGAAAGEVEGGPGNQSMPSSWTAVLVEHALWAAAVTGGPSTPPTPPTLADAGDGEPAGGVQGAGRGGRGRGRGGRVGGRGAGRARGKGTAVAAISESDSGGSGVEGEVKGLEAGSGGRRKKAPAASAGQRAKRAKKE